MQTKIWAHRGSSHKYIENSLAAFKQAIRDEADGIELDVQRTADGKLVVIHDENLKRLTGLDKFLWQLNWEDLQALNLQSTVATIASNDADNLKIPLLEDVLHLMKDSGLVINIELKNSIHFYPGMEEEVVDLVKQRQMEEQVIYSSFNHAAVQRLATLSSPEASALLTSDIIYEPWTYLQTVKALNYHPMLNSLQQPDLIETCRKNNIKVHVWTADETDYINVALLLGVDAIITNKPDKAIQLRQQFNDGNGKKALESARSLGFPV